MQLPVRVLLGQCVAALGLMLVAWAVAPATVWSVGAGALCCVVPGALFAQWVWRRSSLGLVGIGGLVAQQLTKLVLSGAALAVVLSGNAKVDPFATLLGFAVCVATQPVVLFWASSRR